MARTIVFGEFLTAVDADILAGSELDPIPGKGVLIIRAASTVNTATLAVNGNKQPAVSSARAVTLRANGEALTQDQGWILFVEKAEKVTAALAGTTGTVGFHAQYIGE